MRRLRKSEWATLVGLVVLSLVPCLGGMLRLFELFSDMRIMPENPRIETVPAPVVFHILSVVFYCLVGIAQFLPTVRKNHPQWHRRCGYLLVVAGIVSALSGLWMTHFYAFSKELQGPLLYVVRLIVSILMIGSLWLGIRAILKRNVAQHQAWMIRAYALGQGAGTQVFVMLPWALVIGEPTGLMRDMLMTFSWVINVIIAEIVIYRSQKNRIAEGDSFGSGISRRRDDCPKLLPDRHSSPVSRT